MAFGNGCFIGEIKTMLTSKVPQGWALLDGTPLDKALYAKLWNEVKEWDCVSKSGNNFAIDMQGKVLIGAGERIVSNISKRPIGSQGGSETHKILSSEMPAHSHGISGTVTPKAKADEANVDDPTGAFMAGDNSGDSIYSSTSDAMEQHC